MEIKIAQKAGFCFGVDRAVKIAYDAANGSRDIFTYGMLIHNADVTRELETLGVKCAENIEDIPKGSTAIIRAHGISKAEYEALDKKGNEIIDATCPFVKRIHKIVEEEYAEGRQIVIAGDENHPEVKGINGWCDNSAIILGSEADFYKILQKDSKTPISMVSQTTLRQEKSKKIEENLKKYFTNAKFFDTICSATEERQQAAKELAQECDLMLVLGGKNSSNTEKLFEICREACALTFKLENEKEVGFALFFHNFSTFLGRAGIYLEDLYVIPEYRGRGHGKGLIKELARIAIERGCGRLEWSCLDWNTPSIDFYLSLGAEQMSEWTGYRFEGESLSELAQKE